MAVETFSFAFHSHADVKERFQSQRTSRKDIPEMSPRGGLPTICLFFFMASLAWLSHASAFIGVTSQLLCKTRSTATPASTACCVFGSLKTWHAFTPLVAGVPQPRSQTISVVLVMKIHHLEREMIPFQESIKKGLLFLAIIRMA